MRKSIRLKLLSQFLFSLTVALFVSFIIQSIYFRPFYLHHIEDRLIAVVQLVEQHSESEDLQSVLEEIDTSKQVEIIITDHRLHNVVLSYNQTRPSNLERVDRELHEVISEKIDYLQDTHLFTVVEMDPPRLILVKSLSNGGYCIVTHPMESLESSLQVMGYFHYLAGTIACIIGVFVTFFLAKRFTRPIIEISKATEAMSRLDFQHKIDCNSQDELGQLARSINILSEKLEANGIALQNEVAFQKVLSQNMSHELKTPISVIKGYLEALSFGVVEDEETKAEYISVVLQECDRMNELISQMLHLSKLNSYQDSILEKEFITPSEFVEMIRLQSQAMLGQNNISFQSDFLCTTPIYAHRDLITQAFGNFVSNAVKYGDGKLIKIKVEDCDSHHRLSLLNTGKPISEEEAKKVFDVFYMVDKVRGRENNSHGLGLSVTKTITDLHQGTVGATVEEGGMSFFIVLPKYTETTRTFHKKTL